MLAAVADTTPKSQWFSTTEICFWLTDSLMGRFSSDLRTPDPSVLWPHQSFFFFLSFLKKLLLFILRERALMHRGRAEEEGEGEPQADAMLSAQNPM